MSELDNICKHKKVFNGTLYMMKPKKSLPWQPSGYEGRYSGNGTPAYYFGDTPVTCWREILNHNPQEEYTLWAVAVNGTFIDVGAVKGTQYILPKDQGGWAPTQELSKWLNDRRILGFQYASHPAIAQGTSGTCFCVYQSSLNLSQEEFHKISSGDECFPFMIEGIGND